MLSRFLFSRLRVDWTSWSACACDSERTSTQQGEVRRDASRGYYSGGKYLLALYLQFFAYVISRKALLLSRSVLGGEFRQLDWLNLLAKPPDKRGEVRNGC